MEKAKVIERLIKESGYTIRSFALRCGIPESTLYTILKNGAGRASTDNILTICRNLGIKVEELDDIAKKGSTEPIETEVSYDDVKYLIARNGKQLTDQQKRELINSLLEDLGD